MATSSRREDDLIILRRTLLQIPDFDRLARFVGFGGGYLHQEAVSSAT